MDWYSAKILQVAYRNGVLPQPALADECIHIFKATDDTHAAARAETIGRSQEHDFLNDVGETVEWRFVRVVRVISLSEAELQDGSEVYSTMFYIDTLDDLNAIED